MVVVSNTSPISNLIIIGEISLLQQIYAKVLIPPAVYSELTRLPTLQPTMISLLSAGWLEIQAPTNLMTGRSKKWKSEAQAMCKHFPPFLRDRT